MNTFLVLLLSLAQVQTPEEIASAKLVRLPYNHPGLVVDLGVGLWAHPLPMDFDQDGDFDLVVVTPDVPSNGIYFFENPDGSAFPVFKPGKWLSKGERNPVVSYVDGTPRVTTPGKYHPDFVKSGFANPVDIPVQRDLASMDPRADQWKFVDFDGDGLLDVIYGIGDWSEYGWDNAFNAQGEWTKGPLHGYVFIARNTGTNEQPVYAAPEPVMAGAGKVDTFGAPSPNFADFDGDGDLDLMCGEFLDRLTYFKNEGTRTEPRYAAGVFLQHNGQPIRMDLEMLQVIALDWDRDGDTDLIVGQEDGRVAWVEHTGTITAGMPQFQPPRFFQQEAESLKLGALCTPFGFDWDHDGDEDLIAGDSAGYISFIENLDGGNPPKWAAPVYLNADGETIRIQAGPNGSIQGPAEAKWGYTVLNVADWDLDGLSDIVINNIWGKVLWFQNAGTLEAPVLKASQPVEVEWEGETPQPAWYWWHPEGKNLVTQWRTTPYVHDLNNDGLPDLIMLDTEGFLAFYERARREDKLLLLPPKRIFLDEQGAPLQLNPKANGRSGRRQFALIDWDNDGKLDMLLDSKNMDFLRNIAEEPGKFQFVNMGRVDTRILAGHTTSPALVDWNRDGLKDLIIGAEDGFFYYLQR